MTDTENTQTQPTTPEDCYWTKIAGRDILVRNINPGQSMILAKMARSVNGETDWAFMIDALGKIGRLFDALIVNDEDRQWLEDGILEGRVQVDDFAQIWVGTITAAEKPTKMKPKRGR